jgi:hypothetical protein
MADMPRVVEFRIIERNGLPEYLSKRPDIPGNARCGGRK